MELDEWKHRMGENAGLRAAADSPEARALSRQVDAKAAEAALRRGDTEELRRILSRVLATPEGRRLAQTVQDAVRGDG